jgi:uncharacterized phage-associated protein
MYSEKFKNLILYILESDHYEDGGIKKLNKILYFIDFYFYREHEKFISDVQYAKAGMGPIVDNYKIIFQELCDNGILEKDSLIGVVLHRPLIKADIKKFSSEEIDHIHHILERYGRLSSMELESISHEQQPWILTEKNGDIIDPDLALLIANENGEEVEVKNKAIEKELIALADKV